MSARLLSATIATLAIAYTTTATGDVSAQKQEPVFRATLLGTGNPRPTLDRFGPATLIEAGNLRLLFDAGRGASIRLFSLFQASGLSQLDGVFLTHLHSDHVVGFSDIWLTGWIFGRDKPLALAGPPGTRQMADHLTQAHDFDIRMRRDIDERFPADGVRIDGRDVQPGVVFERDGVRVSAFAVDHAPVTPAYGYRIEVAGRSVVISGDTRPSESLVKHAAGADVLIHEVISAEADRRLSQLKDPAATERVIAHHTTPEQAGQLFARIRPKLAVYTHIVPSPATEKDLIAPTRRYYDGRLEAGVDGLTIDVGPEIRVSHRAWR